MCPDVDIWVRRQAFVVDCENWMPDVGGRTYVEPLAGPAAQGADGEDGGAALPPATKEARGGEPAAISSGVARSPKAKAAAPPYGVPSPSPGAVATAAGGRVRHLKLHGALSNMASEDEVMARACYEAALSVDPELIVMVLAATAQEAAVKSLNCRWAGEIFADRAYKRHRKNHLKTNTFACQAALQYLSINPNKAPGEMGLAMKPFIPWASTANG